jgi:hypothetical protein
VTFICFDGFACVVAIYLIGRKRRQWIARMALSADLRKCRSIPMMPVYVAVAPANSG